MYSCEGKAPRPERVAWNLEIVGFEFDEEYFYFGGENPTNRPPVEELLSVLQQQY